MTNPTRELPNTLGALRTSNFSEDRIASRTVKDELRSNLICMLQRGEALGLPHSRSMPAIGPRCHELRINDAAATFRIMYRADPDAVVILEVFSKKTQQTPRTVIEACKRRLRDYDRLTGGQERKR